MFVKDINKKGKYIYIYVQFQGLKIFVL